MKLILQFVRTPFVACIATGFVLGQMVLAMAERQDHRLAGFGCAAMCVLSAGTSLTLFLRHQHVQSGRPAQSAPVHAWVVLLGLAVLASIGLGG